MTEVPGDDAEFTPDAGITVDAGLVPAEPSVDPTEGDSTEDH